ncbi:helix-turn-helix domain-containing protein [Planctomycetota bacterium]
MVVGLIKDSRLALIFFNMETNRQQNSSSQQQFLTIKNVATILNVSKDYVRRLLRDGFLSGIKMPGTGNNAPVRIIKDSFDEFIRSHELRELDSRKGITRPRKKSQSYTGIFTK